MSTPQTITLSPAQRRELKARAHAQKPVVMIGSHGLTPAVMAEIGRALEHHELIKIHVAGDDRDVRAEWFDQICAETGAASVQHIGKILVIFKPRPAPEPTALPSPAAKRRPPASKTAQRRKSAVPPGRMGLFKAQKPDLRRLSAATGAESAVSPARANSRVGWQKSKPGSARPRPGTARRG